MIEHNITPIVIVIGALVVIALGVMAYLYMRTRRIELECELLLRGTEGTNFVEIVNDNIDQVHGLLEEVEALSERYAAVLRRVAGAVQHVGVVRFDAFRDLGGLLSFAVALLDDRGNGLVFSSIYGRSESRTYAKPVIERSSSYELSPEEREAIRLAMQSKEMGALPVEAKDREHEERMANLRLFHDKEYLSRSPEARAEAEARIREERLDVEQRPPARRPQPPAEEPPRRPPAPKGKQPGKHEAPRKRKAGRANHIRPVERQPELEPEPAPSGGRSLQEEVERLLEPPDEAAPGGEPRRTERRNEPGYERNERPARPRTPERTGERTAPQKRPAPNEPRARGLDTPVERLRNREQD